MKFATMCRGTNIMLHKSVRMKWIDMGYFFFICRLRKQQKAIELESWWVASKARKSMKYTDSEIKGLSKRGDFNLRGTAPQI